MKQCSSCAREIPDSATLCDACRQWAVGVTAAPAAASSASTQVAEPPAAPAASASVSPAGSSPASPSLAAAVANRRGMLITLCALAGIGVFALALLSARGGSSTDAANARAAVPASSAAAIPAESSLTQKWSADNSAYWVGSRRQSVAFELPAENTVRVWLRSARPTLVVRCMARSTQVFVVTESAMKIEPDTEDHTVRYSIDQEPEVTERWPDSDEHDALFAPDGHAFAMRLMRARTFRFGYTPHNADPVVTLFNVSGLTPLIEPAAKECGWKQ